MNNQILTINDLLKRNNDQLYNINSSIQTCFTLLDMPINNVENIKNELFNLIDNIFLNLDEYKNNMHETQILNFKTIVKYKDQEMTLLNLLKIKETIKLKLDKLEMFMNKCNHKSELVTIYLQLKINHSVLKKEYSEINHIINKYNQQPII